MSGCRFRVVLCAYERYIMPLYMYYRVVVDTLNDFPYIYKHIYIGLHHFIYLFARYY